MATIKVAMVGDVPSGEGKVVQANGKEIAVFNCDGTFYAIDNTCLHKGGPLGEGVLEDSIVTCPWHGWKYDVKTGISAANPAIKVKSYPVKIEEGEVKVEL